MRYNALRNVADQSEEILLEMSRSTLLGHFRVDAKRSRQLCTKAGEQRSTPRPEPAPDKIGVASDVGGCPFL